MILKIKSEPKGRQKIPFFPQIKNRGANGRPHDHTKLPIHFHFVCANGILERGEEGDQKRAPLFIEKVKKKIFFSLSFSRN